MPPKTRGKKTTKAKSSSVVDGLSTEDMSKDQLEEHIVRLREELDREREERSYFQLERDKIMTFWEISKRDLEETKAELRNRLREREEAEERHRVEISVYKQKLKHVLSEHHNTITELKLDGLASSSLIQDQYTESELRLRKDRHDLQEDRREKQLQNQNCIKEVKLKHQVELMELINVYETRIRELEVKYHKTMQQMVEEDRRKRQQELSKMEERMRRRVAVLAEKHNKALGITERYYVATQQMLDYTNKGMKHSLVTTREKHSQLEKKHSEAQQENQRLHTCLQDLEQKLSELQQQLLRCQQTKASFTESKALLKLKEQELRELTVEHELLLQACQKVEQERDELLRSQTEAVLDVQQRSSLKELLLQRKLAALTQTLEKNEAQLCSALSGTHSAPRVQEILESKDGAISALQDDLARVGQEYDDLLQVCQERLRAQGVPLLQFPFRPAEQVLNGTAPNP